MNLLAAGTLLVSASGLFGLPAEAGVPPHDWQPLVPAAVLGGRATMSVWGFDIYQATLWVAPGFVESAYAQHPFALELAYLRDFKCHDMARRSIMEMRRQTATSPTNEARWEGQLRAVFPDVKAGDRLAGIYLPGIGMQFRRNGRLLGEVRDPEFARLFFGIWLSPRSSAPVLRRALIAQVPPPGAAAAPAATEPQ